MRMAWNRALGLLTAVVAASVAAQSSEALRNVKIGDPLPDFSVSGLDGRTYTLAGCKDKVLLLLFVRPEQERSLAALLTVQRLAAQVQGAAVTVLAVSSDEKGGDYFKRVAADNGLTLPIALDPGRKMYGALGLVVTPTTLLVDPKGIHRFELPHVPPDYERSLAIHLDLLLGRIDQKTHDERLQQIRQDANAWNDTVQTRMAYAQTLNDRGAFDEAIPVWQALQKQKDNAQVAAGLATAYLGLDRLDDAAACLKPFAEEQPLPPVLNLPLARLEARRGRDEEAERFLQAALKISPQKAAILFELGRLYERRDRCDLAVDCYRKALEEVLGAH